MNSPIIREIEKEIGTDAILSLLFVQLRKTNDLVNVDGRLKLTDDQCTEIAVMLLEEFPTETLEDFALAFRKGITGKYDDKLFRVDVQVVFRWVRCWLEEKAEYREKLHKVTKKEEILPLTDEQKSNIDKIIAESWVGQAMKEMKDEKEEFNKFKNEWLKKRITENQNENTI